jgi:hypothetical protein
MTDNPAALAAVLGYVAPAPRWDLGTAEPVPMARWGKDHWTTFAYVDTRWVDHRGMLNHEQMRCDGYRHPAFYAYKRRALAFGTDADGGRYPTRLKSDRPRPVGSWGSVDLPGHDDYNCLDDAIREGLIEAHLPQPACGDIFLDAWDRGVKFPDGEQVRPSFVTGMSELCLMAHASFSLTSRGQVIAGQLRAHIAATRQPHQFMPQEG